MRNSENAHTVAITPGQLADLMAHTKRSREELIAGIEAMLGSPIKIMDTVSIHPFYFGCGTDPISHANGEASTLEHCRVCGAKCYHGKAIDTTLAIIICMPCMVTANLPSDPENFVDGHVCEPSLDQRITIYASQIWRDPLIESYVNSNTFMDVPVVRKIINLGEKAIPSILKHFDRYAPPWPIILLAMVEKSEWPKGVSLADTYEDSRRRWLQWGVEKGYIESFDPNVNFKNFEAYLAQSFELDSI